MSALAICHQLTWQRENTLVVSENAVFRALQLSGLVWPDNFRIVDHSGVE